MVRRDGESISVLSGPGAAGGFGGGGGNGLGGRVAQGQQDVAGALGLAGIQFLHRAGKGREPEVGFPAGALYAAGFANQPSSDHRDDGLKLSDCYVTAAVRCAPPENKPNLIEFKRCRPYLVQELKLFGHVRVVVALGKIAFDAVLLAYRENGGIVPRPRPKFGHGLSTPLPNAQLLICSYHPSQQNTFTGKLTQSMFQDIVARAKAALAE